MASKKPRRRKPTKALVSWRKAGRPSTGPKRRRVVKAQRAPTRKLPKGYTALGGSSRRYRTPSGATISRRKMDNLIYRSMGYKSKGEYEYQVQRRRSPTLRHFMQRAGKRNVGPTDELARAWVDVQREGGMSHDPRDPVNRVGGPADRLLKAAGLRPPDADWNVGDS